MADKPKTRAELEAELVSVRELVATANRGLSAERAATREAEAREKETRAQFNDLKTRLAIAELDNQRLRGYIARVQEDDVVREELVISGEPDGQQQLVPKRKSRLFHEPNQMSPFGGESAAGPYHERDRIKPRHWVTY